MTEILLDTTSYRLVPEHAPAVQAFANLLDPDELDLACALADMTNDRARDQLGDISLLPARERVAAEGSRLIMEAFIHCGVESRFSDGGHGVYYAALSLDTALEESAYSLGRFLSSTGEDACEIMMACYSCKVRADFLDLRGEPHKYLHKPGEWQASQRFAAERRARGAKGLFYRSVSSARGECIAAFSPSALQPPALRCGYFRFVWDGEKIDSISSAGG